MTCDAQRHAPSSRNDGCRRSHIDLAAIPYADAIPTTRSHTVGSSIEYGIQVFTLNAVAVSRRRVTSYRRPADSRAASISAAD